MVRTQIFLTEKENHLLGLLAEKQGVSRSELIRQALDVRLGLPQPERIRHALSAAFGCLKGASLRTVIRRQRARW